MKKGLKDLFLEEDGIGTVEMILILVVLIALVTIFKSQLTTLVGELFTSLSENAKGIKQEGKYHGISYPVIIAECILFLCTVRNGTA